MDYDPNFNYSKGIEELRTRVRQLAGSNISDRGVIKEYIEYLRERIAHLKNEFTEGTGDHINDDMIDFENPPVSTVAKNVLIDEMGINPPASADPGNGMMPDPDDLGTDDDLGI